MEQIAPPHETNISTDRNPDMISPDGGSVIIAAAGRGIFILTFQFKPCFIASIHPRQHKINFLHLDLFCGISHDNDGLPVSGNDG